MKGLLAGNSLKALPHIVQHFKDIVALDANLGSHMMRAVVDINYYRDISVPIPDDAFNYLDMAQETIDVCALT